MKMMTNTVQPSISDHQRFQMLINSWTRMIYLQEIRLHRQVDTAERMSRLNSMERQRSLANNHPTNDGNSPMTMILHFLHFQYQMFDYRWFETVQKERSSLFVAKTRLINQISPLILCLHSNDYSTVIVIVTKTPSIIHHSEGSECVGEKENRSIDGCLLRSRA